MSDLIRIRREELYAKGVEDALARDRQLRGRRPETPPVSPLRAFLLSPLFYLPCAGGLAAFLVWLLVEPSFKDIPVIGGEIRLVNRDPFEFQGTLLSIGDVEIAVVEPMVRLEEGAEGQPPFESLADLEPGVTAEVAAEETGQGRGRLLAMAIRPASPEHAAMTGTELPAKWVQFLLFPLTAILVAVSLLAAEGIASRNWVRMVERTLLGALLTLVFSVLAFLPAVVFIVIGMLLLRSSVDPGDLTTGKIPAVPFLVLTACRSAAWACLAAGLGLGMNLVRSTKVQLRNSVVGGALGGALGGMFFDPIDRFSASASMFEQDAAASRLVGLVAVGACVGLFLALVEQLAREAWVRVRTGPLAGKSFVLYKTPTTVGSAPQADIYLFKDAEIGPRHAAIHRVGNRYEIEDLGSRAGVKVGGRAVRRHRLASGDQIILGATVLEFEERTRKT